MIQIQRTCELQRSNVHKSKNGDFSQYKNVIVWGTGSSGHTAYRLLGNRVDCFVDSYSSEASMFGISVHKPEYLGDLGQESIVIIASVAFREIQSWISCEAPEVATITLNDLLTDRMPRNSELERLKVDMLVYYNKSWFNSWLTQPQLSVNITYRVCRALASRDSLWRRFLLVPARIWHTLTGAFFGIELPVTVEAGAGLQFVHCSGIVVHDNARLGEFCRIYQNVTIGSDRRGKAPVLGDHVTMWAGSIAIGGCKLGDFTQVGANSVCTGEVDVRDVSLAGSPAKPVGRRQPLSERQSKPST